MTKSFRLAVPLFCLALIFSAFAGLRAAASDISGNWAFVLATEGGDRNANAMFKLDGKTVSGTWGENGKVAGTFDGDALDLSFPYESSEVGPGTMAIKGKLANDELTGSWAFREYSGTFKATRIANPAK